MKLAIVLNYNNYIATTKAVTCLKNSGIEKIVIVDNNSNNESFDVFNQKFGNDSMMYVVKNTLNIGYAQGNNIGLKVLSNEKLITNNNIIFIVNPDVIVNSDLINHISDFILKTPNAGVVSGVSENGRTAWHHINKLSGFFFNMWIIKWILYKFNVQEGGTYKLRQGVNKIVPVDVISGAFFGINARTFKSIDYFDPGTFLYYEEEALFAKLSKQKFQNYILCDESYFHEGRASTSSSKLVSKKRSDESRLFVLKKYYQLPVLLEKLMVYINKFDNFLFILLSR
jgi:N-acetylglucosaminyl-diphospho-decaprenol L-rhamnosyltransferase